MPLGDNYLSKRDFSTSVTKAIIHMFNRGLCCLVTIREMCLKYILDEVIICTNPPLDVMVICLSRKDEGVAIFPA